MGLLDALFNSDTYGGQGGGLLDLIRQSQAQNSQYQPGDGFMAGNNQPSPLDTAQWPAGPNGAPPQDTLADRFNAMPGAPQQFAPSGRDFNAAQFDPQTFAPNQAQPIAVGGYQMPRMGDAGQYQPQQAMLPPNAQPTQGQLPQGQPVPMQAPQPQQELPPAFGGGSILGRLGNPDGLIARLTGNDSRSVSQQNLKAQYDALQRTLIDGGMTPREAQSKAMLAVMNPDAGKTILQEALTSKQKYGVISKDPLEGEKYGFINERDQTINGQPVTAQPAAGGSLATLQAAQSAGVTGPALYEHLPASMRGVVKAMVEGRQPLPSTTAMRSPATLALIDAAHAIDPTFDATVWKARNEAGPDWTKGKSSEMVRSANQTLAHVGSLMNAMDNLKNRQMPAWNAVANTVSEQFGAGEQGSFRTNAHAVAEEMSKVFKGANLSDAEIRHWEQNLSENMSPTQQKAQIAKLSELLHGSLQALEEKRLAAMGPAAAEKAGPLIKAEGQAVLERIDKWVKGNSSEPAKPAGIDRSAIEAEMRKRGLMK